MTDIPPDDVLLCGCIIRCAIEEGRRVMKFIPCRKTCRNLALTLEMAKERSLPVEYRDAP